MIRDPFSRLRVLAFGCLAVVLVGTPGSAGIERKPEFLDRVAESIDRGAKHLLDVQESDGSWDSMSTALAYHTLRVCGIPKDHAQMKAGYKALKRMRKKSSRTARSTYTVALTMMCIEDHGERLKDAGTRQGADRSTKLSTADKAWMKELVGWMESKQSKNGAWRYGYENERDEDYDHSCTQYALLGLKAASRSGVKVKTSTYLRALQHLIRAQQPKGEPVRRERLGAVDGETRSPRFDEARGWSYTSLEGTRYSGDPPKRRRGGMRPFGGAYGSMTAGCVGAVVICRSELLGRPGYSNAFDRRAEKSVRDGLAWLGANFSVTRNPGHPIWHHYYLYALERAGVLAGVEWMGRWDWYLEGAEYLMESQEKSGAWSAPRPGLPGPMDTCFSLLFLRKGTIRVVRGAVTPSSTINFHAAEKLSDRDFEDFIDLVLSAWSRTEDADFRRDLARRTARVGPRVVFPLLRRLDASTEKKRRAAHAVLTGATGMDLPFDPAADAAARANDVARWEEWYVVVTGHLVFDEKSGRLRPR